MVDHFSHAFGVPNQLIMAEYDARTEAALTRPLPPNAAQLLIGQLDEALAERELSSLGSKRPCRINPHPPFGKLEASLRTMVARKRLKIRVNVVGRLARGRPLLLPFGVET